MAVESIRIAVKGHYDSVDQIVNVFSFYGASVAAMPTLASVASWLDNFYAAGLLALMSTGVLFERFVIERHAIAGWTYQGEAAYVKQGTVSGDPLPHMDSVLITGITNSKLRAKKFIPGLMENFQSNGVLTSGALSAVNTIAAHWLDSLVSGSDTYIPCTLSKTAATMQPLTAVRVDSRVHALNRRFPGRGS